MGYFYLLLTILTETAAVLFMKSSNGFQQKASSLVAVVAYMLSFVFLTLALKRMPVGTANAVWAGTSTLLVAILGVFIFKETINMRQLIFLGMIVIGLVGLQWD